jgi:hypothetical protein
MDDTGLNSDINGDIPKNKRNGNGITDCRDDKGRWAQGNPGGGRTKGARNKRSLEIAAEIAKLGIDPLLFLAKVSADKNTELVHRISAASAILPYLYSRSRIQRFLTNTFELPPPTDAMQAAAQVAMINARVAAGQLDIEDAQTLVKNLQTWVGIYVSTDLENTVRTIVENLRNAETQTPPRPNLVAIGK